MKKSSNGRSLSVTVWQNFPLPIPVWDTIQKQKSTNTSPKNSNGAAKICRHFALDRLDWKSAAKRKAEVVSLTDEMTLCIPDSQRERELVGKELGQLLDAFLRTLTPENRMVFMRRYWYVDTIAEISARFGISESAVQMRLSRTRAKLSSYLEKEGIRV